jgi:hypothetical protein
LFKANETDPFCQLNEISLGKNPRKARREVNRVCRLFHNCEKLKSIVATHKQALKAGEERRAQQAKAELRQLGYCGCPEGRALR